MRRRLAAVALGLALLLAGCSDDARPTTVRTPSPTVDSTPQRARPGPGTTGVPAGTVLREHLGDLTLSTPGEVVEGLDVRGFVRIDAPGVTLRSSRIRGGITDDLGGNRALLSSTAPGVQLADLDLVPDHPSVHVDGLKGYGFTATRLDVHGVVDAVVVHGPGTTVTASWLHDLRHYEVDPGQGGGPSHDDGVQVQAGTGIRLSGNVIEGGANSALQVTQDVGVAADLQLTGNWLDGGACTVNVAEKGRGPIEGLVVSDNLFGRRSSVPGCAATVPTSTPLVADDNRYDDGQPVTIRRD